MCGGTTRLPSPNSRALLKPTEGWEGAFTHFHSAESDPASVTRQWERFQAALSRLPHRPPLIHAANSAVALRGGPETADLVRPGIFLYGCGIPGLPAPRPVAALRAPVVAVRQIPQGESVSYGATWRAATDTTVATLGAGYADGVMRSLSGRGQVELGGASVPIIGRVTMDMTMAAVPAGSVRVGDIATFYGGVISLDEQAAAAGTIGYELLTALGSRVQRRYGAAR